MNYDRTGPTKGNILIVDDVLENLNFLQATLTQHGYDVRKAINGQMALMGAEAAPPDLILLDIKMPEMDGYEVCRRLKASERTREIPIIFVSALATVLDKVKAFSAGGVDYITKPFQAEEVIVRVESQLALQAARAEVIRLNAELEDRVQQRTLELEVANHDLRIEIVERRRAELQLRQQAKQEQLVRAIAQHIRESLDLETILTTTVNEVRQFLQVERVLIYRFLPDWSGIVIVESVCDPKLSILGKLILDHCFMENYADEYRKGKVQSLEDIYQAGLSQCHIDLLAVLKIRANLLVPIVQDETLWGLLIANQCTKPRAWAPLEIELLKQLSTQVAIAIQQSELYQKVQQFNLKLEQQVQERTLQLQQSLDFEAALKRITDKVRDSLDENQILQTAVQELAHVLKVKCCNAGIYNADLTTSTIAFEYTTLISNWGQVVQMAHHQPIYQHLLQSQNVQSCPISSTKACESHGPFTILSCPVFDDQGVIGDLWLFKPASATFEELEVRLVQQVANQCAIALRQARLYAAAQAQVEALESLHQLKDDFLSTVSHELRSPVANIKMAIQMLEVTVRQFESLILEAQLNQREAQDIKALKIHFSRIAQYLHILDSECDREISLVNDLLDLQRLEANKQPLVTERVDLNLWLPVLVDSFEERAQARQQYLILEMPEQLPPMETDSNALGRIMAELLHNACKYTPPEEKIVLQVQYTSDTLQLQVTNFGTEIPAKELPRIFDKFYRVLSTDRWQQGGTGLGLALVKKLVEHLGGTITVDSKQTHTTFAIELPFKN